MANIIKNKDQYKLFIDELGTASLKDVKSDLYILAGCMVKEEDRKNIKTWSDHIKFKYWGHLDIIWHSREIGRKERDFKIFKTKKIFNSFLSDLEEFLICSNFKMFFILVDKNKARNKNWNDVKIYKETSGNIIKNFLITLLYKNSQGKIIIESATAEKDFYFHKALGFYLSEGIREIKIKHEKVKETLTSISFVTKNNYDIEEQLSDLLAYGAKCKFLKNKCAQGAYEKMILKVLSKKLYKKPRKTNKNGKKYLNEIDSFLTIP